jgi:hypothetical protein
LVPGQEAIATMRVSVPATPGTYQATLLAVAHKPEAQAKGPESSLRLIVEQAAHPGSDRFLAASMQAVHQALVDAECKQSLPVEYLDVTQGFLAKWKRWIKRKLLGNFKHSYVDVLSRQQSAFNRQTLTALQELTECCALLDHTLAALEERLRRLEDAGPRTIGSERQTRSTEPLSTSIADGA